MILSDYRYATRSGVRPTDQHVEMARALLADLSPEQRRREAVSIYQIALFRLVRAHHTCALTRCDTCDALAPALAMAIALENLTDREGDFR